MTREELAAADGRDGRAALIACDGLVYDVSKSWHWRGGRHQVLHPAGADLTAELAAAPHGADLLERLPAVGHLVEGGADPADGAATGASGRTDPAR